jgi:hypothetical protein
MVKKISRIIEKFKIFLFNVNRLKYVFKHDNKHIIFIERYRGFDIVMEINRMELSGDEHQVTICGLGRRANGVISARALINHMVEYYK